MEGVLFKPCHTPTWDSQQELINISTKLIANFQLFYFIFDRLQDRSIFEKASPCLKISCITVH